MAEVRVIKTLTDLTNGRPVSQLHVLRLMQVRYSYGHQSLSDLMLQMADGSWTPRRVHTETLDLLLAQWTPDLVLTWVSTQPIPTLWQSLPWAYPTDE